MKLEKVCRIFNKTKKSNLRKFLKMKIHQNSQNQKDLKKVPKKLLKLKKQKNKFRQQNMIYTFPAMASPWRPLPPNPTGDSFGCATTVAVSTSTAARSCDTMFPL